MGYTKVLILTVLLFHFTFLLSFAGGNPLQYDHNAPASENYFTENKGQVTSFEERLPVPSVLFYTKTGLTNIFFKSGGISYIFNKTDIPEPDINDPYSFHNFKFNGEWERIDMELVNCNSKPVIEKEDIQNFYENYYLAHCPDGINKVKCFKRVTYKNIYPFIDWVLYFNGNNQLKYDFVVHPGGNPEDIKIRYKWADTPEFMPDGSVNIRGPLGRITENQPVTIQNNDIISSEWISVNENTIGFKIDKFDPSSKLIIDPVLIWATYYGSSLNDMGYSIKSDSNNVFVTGATTSLFFPTYDPGTGCYYQGTYTGGFDTDIYIIKFDNNGVRQWATYYGGTSSDGREVITFNTNYIYLSGQTTSEDLPTYDPGTGAYYQPNNGQINTSDAFILMFDKNGFRQWATYLGGDFWDAGYTIYANDNYLYAGLSVSSTNMPIFDPGGSAFIQSLYGGFTDNYILKLTSAGIPLWGTYFGGTDVEEPFPAIKEINGDVYLTGGTSSPDFPTFDPGGTAFFQASGSGSKDITVSRFNSNCELVWSTYLGGSADEAVRTIDGNNQIWIGGFTSSNNIPTYDQGNGTFFQGTISAGIDAYLASFNSNNELVWATYVGGNSNDWINSLCVDSKNLWLGGRTYSTNLPVQNPGMGSFFQGTKSTGQDAFIAKFKLPGILQWLTYYGGNGNEDITTIHSDNAFVWATGTTGSTNLFLQNPTGGAYFQSVNFGGNEIFILKFDVCIKPNVSVTASSPAICLYDSTQLTASGALTYQWLFPPSTEDTIFVSPSNDSVFIVIGTDDMNCIDTGIVTVTVNPLPQLTITNPDSICYLDSITLIVSSDLPSYYLWAPGNQTDSFIVVAPDTVNMVFYYDVFVTDTLNGCINSAQTSVFVNPLPQLSITPPDSVCYGDSLALTVSSNMPSYYLWTPGGQTDSSVFVTPDTVNMNFFYSVLVTDTVNGCMNSIQTSVFVNPLPQLSITPPDSVCYGDSLALTVSSNMPSNYLWTPGGQTDSSITVTPDTVNMNFIYTVIVTDTVNGCMSSAQTSVFVNPLPQLTITQPDSICFGDSATLTVSSNLPSYYLWAPGGQTDSSVIVTPDTVNMNFFYSVLVTDTANGCKSSAQTSVYVNPLPQLTILQPDSICFRDSITLTVTSDLPSSFIWTPGNYSGSAFTVSPSGINAQNYYTVTATDTVNGCINYASTFVYIHALPELYLSPPDSVCKGDTVTVYAVSNMPVYFLWSPPNGTDSTQYLYNVFPSVPYQTFTYTVLATDTLYGCKNTDSTTVFVHGKPEISITGSFPICVYDSVTLSVVNYDTISLSYLWTPSFETTPSIVFNPNYPDSIYYFTLYATSVYGCKDTALTFVNVHPDIAVNILPGDTAICYKDIITLTGTGYNINTYLWGPSIPDSAAQSIQVSPDSMSVFHVEVTSAQNCKDYDTITIIVYPLPSFNINDTTICNGDDAVMNVFNIFNGSTVFTWQPGNLNGSSVIVSPLVTTTFTVTGTDTNTCQYITSVTVQVDSLPEANISGIDRICYGESTTLFASGGVNYYWSTGETSSSITVTPLSSTSYTLISNSTICYDTSSVFITVDPKPVLDVTDDTTLIIGMSLQLNVNGANTYSWSPVSDLSCFTCPSPVARPLSSIEYCVEGINTFGCIDTACVYITIDAECGEIFVPSAFSPNGDSQNDILYVYGKCVKTMDFRIFNRWGEKVFETTDPETGWDGLFRGKNADTDVFVYYLHAEYYIGTTLEQKGTITLLR